MKELEARTTRLERMIRNITGYGDPIDWEEALTVYGINSMKTMELVIMLEGEFDIQFDDEELVLERFSSTRKIMERLEEKLAEEG